MRPAFPLTHLVGSQEQSIGGAALQVLQLCVLRRDDAAQRKRRGYAAGIVPHRISTPGGSAVRDLLRDAYNVAVQRNLVAATLSSRHSAVARAGLQPLDLVPRVASRET